MTHPLEEHVHDARTDDPADESPDVAAPLDLLLHDATRSPLRRFLPGMSGVRFAAGLARRPRRVVGRAAHLSTELAKAGLGRSDLEPHEKDRRFADEAWAKNPFLRRTLQGYLAAGETLRGLVPDAELDWGDEQRMGFIVDNLVEASAPSNNPLLNPVVLKRVVDTGGGSLVNGGRRFVRDFATAPRVPSMVEPDAFEVGRDIAVTPGAVVLRTDVFELIQYTPQTPKVRSVPLLIVPPTINKYYVIDLAEHAAWSSTWSPRASRSTASRGATPTPGTPTGAWTRTAGRSSRRWARPARSPGRSRWRCSASAPAGCSPRW